MKKIKKTAGQPFTISTVPYPLQQSQKRKKPVQSRQPLQASAQINCTGPALHTTESHTKIYDPARQRNSHGPSTPKINRPETSVIDRIHTNHHLYIQRKTGKSRRKKKQYSQEGIKEYQEIQGSLNTSAEE